MTKPLFRSHLFTLTASVALSLAASTADAALITYDLRVATSGQTAGVVRVNDKSATVSASTDVVVMDLYALLSATDANTGNDGVKIAYGSFHSSAGGLKGNLSATLANNFSGLASSVGTIGDLDSDGDLDIGNLGTANGNTGFFAASSTASSAGLPTHTGGATALLGQVWFSVADLAGGSTHVRFAPRKVNSGGSALQRDLYHQFTVDGTNLSRGDGLAADISDIATGAPVQITSTAVVVPEPTSLLLLPAAALAHLLRRRRRS